MLNLMRKSFLIYILCHIAILTSCASNLKLSNIKHFDDSLTGTAFYEKSKAYDQKLLDSLFIDSFFKGQAPEFFFNFRPITVKHTDSLGNNYTIRFYCSPDYVSIGNNTDWARVPITPMAAQLIADSLNCFVPTAKMVNLIYQKSRIKLQPIPLHTFRDSTITMWQHHLLIEGQRKGKKGLISGIKKDIVICSMQKLKGKVDRVAIYGWHKLDSKPIQPLYGGHGNWYVDYSHGARMVYRKIKVNGIWMDYTEFFGNELLSKALSDEGADLMLHY